MIRRKTKLRRGIEIIDERNGDSNLDNVENNASLKRTYLHKEVQLVKE